MKNEFMVYPNPSAGDLNCMLYSENKTSAELKLYDIIGKIVYSGKILQLSERRNDLRFNINVATGILLYNITSSKTNYGTTKVIFK